MKLSFTTLGCPSWSFEKIVEEAGRLGYEGLEIRGVNNEMRAENIAEFFPENFAKTRDLLAKNRVTLMGFGSSAMFHTEERAAAGIEECKKAVDVCARIGIPMIRVFGNDIPDKEKTEETLDLAARSIREVCLYAKDTGVQILLESHGDFNTLETIGGMIERLKDLPNFGILWDVQHSDRAYGDDWRPFYELVKPVLRHMHIKDHVRNADGTFTHCMIGEGDIPLKDIVTALEQDGYDGWYSLEWEKKWVPTLPEPDEALPVYSKLMRSLEKR